MADNFDEDAIRKFFKSMEVDQLNNQSKQLASQGMTESVPPPNPYAGGGGQKKGILGTIGSIAAPVMKLGGMAANFLGAPHIGVPLSIAGGAVGGATEGGLSGALTGAGKAGLTEAATYGMGKGLDFLKGGGGAPIDIASKRLTIPGKRLNPIDMGSYTIPANTSAGGS
jgi:hypothetical protein